MLSKLLTHFIIFTLASASDDITHSGRYTIVKCGEPNTGRLVALLETLHSKLQPSLLDLSFSDPSPAFETFFDSANDLPYVRRIISNVTTGVSLPPRPQLHQTASPVLICATESGQVVGKGSGFDYYYQCLLDPDNGVIAISGTPYIVICPNFWLNRIPDSPTTDNCLKKNRSVNRFIGTGFGFRGFKVWILLEGILRFYIYATRGVPGSFVTDVNRCVNLGARHLVANPSNYVYYVASILSHCRDFTYPSVPRRRLPDGTMVANVTDLGTEGLNATRSAGVVAPSVQAVVVDVMGGV